MTVQTAACCVIDYSATLNNYIIPTLATVLMTMVGGALVWAKSKADAFFAEHKLSAMAAIDTRAASAIQSALQNGANAAIARAKMLAPLETITVSNALTAKVVQHVVNSVPDSLAHFGVTTDRLNTLALAAVNRALGPPTPPAAPLLVAKT